MSKIRVHTLAKEMGISSQEMVEEIRGLGLDIKSYMSTIEEETANLIKDMILDKMGKGKGGVDNKKEKPKKVSKPQKADKTETAQVKDEVALKTPSKEEPAPEKEATEVELLEAMTVKELSERLNIPANDIIKKLMQMGKMVTINQVIDTKIALTVADFYNIKAKVVSVEAEALTYQEEEDKSKLLPRPPVITVMGHVDHGKTLLLDAIRKSNVVSKEYGGITQHIGAYKATLPGGEVTFLDTPGHEAFTAMRARGAQITDIVVLVVAADDGVMPQTIEAINHAKAANVPIVVSINKIDKPEADPQKVRTELSNYGLVPEEWGGKTIFCEISAKKQIGLDHLLEMLLLEAEMLELKANPDRKAVGTIIEAKLDRGRGPVATVLVQNGSLYIGDPFICGLQHGRVRAMIDDKGDNVKTATPSMPVEVLGFAGVPQVGDSFVVVSDDKKARQISAMRLEKQRSHELSKTSRMDLKAFIDKVKEGEVQELNIILKADVQGSVQAITESLERLSTEQVKIKILHAAVGAINETDVLLAASANAIIIGFGIRPEPKASSLAEREDVEIKLFTIIYDLVDTVQSVMKGILKPTYKEVILGRADVRKTFYISKIGTIAGSYITDGKIVRGSRIRVLRDNIIIYSGKISSLKRFKEDAKEVVNGYECGIGIENFNDIKVNDVLECYILKETEATL